MSKELTEGRTVAYSRTEQVHILTMDTINGYGRLFGGVLMQWIDTVAAVVARRHSGKNVTTASVDHMQFAAAAHANDTVVLQGYITYAGNTSMEVCVRSYVEELDGTRNEINTAHLILVAVDDEERPTPVPPIILTTDEERREYEEAEKRRSYRLYRKKENF